MLGPDRGARRLARKEIEMSLAVIWTPGIGELVVILVIIMIFFGVGKLPQIGSALGKGIKNFKGAAEGKPDEIDVTPDTDKDEA
jgi:sec-independent protein translocase protein TatA